MEIGQQPTPPGNVSFRHIKFENLSKFYSVSYPKYTATEDILYCVMYSEGVNDIRGRQLSCQGCETPNEVNTFTILENTKDRLKFSWKMDVYNNGITDAGGNVIEDISYTGIWLYEVNNGKIIEIVQNEIGEIIWRGDLQETTNDFNSICNNFILSN